MTYEDQYKAIRECIAESMHVMPTVRVEFQEEDDDEKLVRQIHEEVENTIRINITLPVHIDYITLKISSSNMNEELSINSDGLLDQE